MYDHDYMKKNLVTISDRTGMYDLLICMKCGKSKKRYGLTVDFSGCKVPDKEVKMFREDEL